MDWIEERLPEAERRIRFEERHQVGIPLALGEVGPDGAELGVTLSQWPVTQPPAHGDAGEGERPGVG